MMPIFVNFKEIKQGASELSHCLLTTKPTELLITTKIELFSASTIQLFPAQAAYLDASSCYKLKNSTSFQQLDAVYLAELNNGLVLHIRNQKTASYTAYIDPFTQIQWETIFDLFKPNPLNATSVQFEVQLGFINISNSISIEIIKQILLKFSQSLQAYLENKSLIVNISAIYHLTNSELLDSANCANILIDITKGTIATCHSLHNCYYPFALAPMDKGALNIKLFDYTSQKDIFLIFCKNDPACFLDTFLAHCCQFSPEYINALRTYKKGDNYDLRFIINYFMGCFTTLFSNSETAQKYFDENLMFYMRNATTIFTAIKIYAALISEPVESLPTKQPDKIPRRRSSETDLLVVHTRKKPAVEQSLPPVDTTSPAHSASPFWKKKSKNSQEIIYQTKNLQGDNPGEIVACSIKIPT